MNLDLLIEILEGIMVNATASGRDQILVCDIEHVANKLKDERQFNEDMEQDIKDSL